MDDEDARPLVLGMSGRSWPRELVGGKGAGLFWMTALQVPVPPFFVVTTEAWREWARSGSLSGLLATEIRTAVRRLEEQAGQLLGAGPDPLLVSVRSSGPVSMPGMMDTVLNLGLTPDALAALFASTGDLRFVNSVISSYGATAPRSWDDVGSRDPGDAEASLLEAVDHVFASASSKRATMYRQMRDIRADLGTAVVVQAMVFGNRDDQSGTGVLFTHDPTTGSPEPLGEWVTCAQGEALVSGRVTPSPLEELGRTHAAVHAQLVELGRRLESADRHPQDIEFTMESGRLFLLQTRRLKSVPIATCRATIAFRESGLLSDDEAWDRLRDLDLDALVTERVDVDDSGGLQVAAGLAAVPGVVRGIAAREIDDAVRRADAGQPVVLIREETSPHDLAGMRRAAAIVTERGGVTSHAAIVARELGIACVVGCGDLSQISPGDQVTVDGSTGRMYEGWLGVRRDIPSYLGQAFSLRAAMESATGRMVGS